MQKARQKRCAGQTASPGMKHCAHQKCGARKAVLARVALVLAALARDGANGCGRAARAGNAQVAGKNAACYVGAVCTQKG